MAQLTDAEVVARIVGGDPVGLAEAYDRYADRLHGYCWSILHDEHRAADAVQDTFVTAATKADQLRDPDRLRPWLYSIARRNALAQLDSMDREESEESMMLIAADNQDPDRDLLDAELAELIRDAESGLDGRDRAILDLDLRHDLNGDELAEVLGVRRDHAYTLLANAKQRIERSLSTLLVSRTGRDACDVLDGLLTGWDSVLTPKLRKRVSRHIDGCEVCEARKGRVAGPAALLAAVPLVPAPPWLRERALDAAATNFAAATVAAATPTAATGGATLAKIAVSSLAILGAGAGIWVMTDASSATASEPVASDSSATSEVMSIVTTTPAAPTTHPVADDRDTPATTSLPATTDAPSFCQLADDARLFFTANQGPTSTDPTDVESYFTSSLEWLTRLADHAPPDVASEITTFRAGIAEIVSLLAPDWNIADLAGIQGPETDLTSVLTSACF